MLEYILFFLLGMLTTYALSYVMALGHSVNVLKQTQKNCAALFVVSDQGLYEILNLKYIAMKEAKRTEQNITAQKYIDQLNIDSIRKTIMKNYERTFPENYKHILEYSTWEEMESFVNKTVKEQKINKD